MWNIVLLLSSGMLIKHVQSQGLSVIGPLFIRPYSNYSVAFSNALNQNAQLRVTLEDKDNPAEFGHSKELIVARRTDQLIQFNIGNISKGNYQLLVQSADETFIFNQQVNLTFDPKTMSAFIQTDKPMYTPGDVIRFRVVVVDADTRPVTRIKTVNITMNDAKKSSIRKWPYAKLYNGVFESQLQLASSPGLGSWTIIVKVTEDIIVTKKIEVKEYALPSFVVMVYPSEVLLMINRKVSFTIETFYTFQQPVEGSYEAKLFLNKTNNKPDFIKSGRITGKTTLEFEFEEEVYIDDDAEYTEVTVNVKVIDAISNYTVDISEKIPIYRRPYVVTFFPTTPSFRPGVRFDGKIVVKDHLGRPPPTNTMASVNLRAAFDLLTGSNIYTVDVDLDERGEGQIVLVPHQDAFKLSVTASYDSQKYAMIHDSIYASKSPNMQYIKVALNPKSIDNIVANEDVFLDISCTETMSYFSYIVVTRGTIVESRNVPVSNKMKHSLRIKMTPEMSPVSRVLVYYTNREYLIFDGIELKFDVFNNEFNVELHESEYFPGQDFHIEVYASKNSYVAFSRIDQSLHLSSNERHYFNSDDVLKELALYGKTKYNGFDLFHKYGLFVKSSVGVNIPVIGSQNAQFENPLIKTKQAAEVESPFIESWLWRNFTMDGRNNIKRIKDTAPGSIGTYYLSGFALSPTLGLGVIQQPVSFNVRKPFYLVANLPYSIKRGEVVQIQVTVFNFLGNSIPTYVTLLNNHDEIEFVDNVNNASTSNTYQTKMVIVTNNHKTIVSFSVRAKKLGQIAIDIEAINVLAIDKLNQMLRVTPESYRFEKSRFIQQPTHGKQMYDLRLNIPRDIDEGSAHINMTVYPNIFGRIFDNLEEWIRKPTGNGEENMLRFAPNIVVLDYLVGTRTVTENVKIKAMDFLKSGYQNQLRYQRSDGAFSTWGPSHAGSTFLTAFVLKSFNIAKKYINVDKSVMDAAFAWLANQQSSDGRFPEVGQVYNADMQGGLRSNSFALTAYVLTAFAENEDVFEQYRSLLERTTNYIAKTLDNMDDAYELSLATYGLMLAKHYKRREFLDELFAISMFANDERYWDRKPVDIEVAGYALLSYIANEILVDALPIKNWLNRQRFVFEGFIGIQNTLVGLKALATCAASFNIGKQDYRITLFHEPNVAYGIDEYTTNVLEIDIPNSIKGIGVEIEGIGFGLLQVAYQYNQSIQLAKPSFFIEIDQLNTTTEDMLQLEVCVKFIPKLAYQLSNMALVEVFLPSGFVADSDAIKDTTGRIRRIESRFSGTVVVIYYDTMGPNYDCFQVTAHRLHKIALQLPAYVVVHDYYNSSRFGIRQYDGKVLQLCDICEDEDCGTLSC